MHIPRKNPDEIIVLNNPTDLPDPSSLDRVEEPYIKASIITKSDFVGTSNEFVYRKKRERLRIKRI